METVEIKSTAIGDEIVYFQVSKIACWPEVSANRHKLNTGVTVEPVGSLIVEMPLEDVAPETNLNTNELAQLLQETLKLVLPTCKVFVQEAEDDFKGEDF